MKKNSELIRRATKPEIFLKAMLSNGIKRICKIKKAEFWNNAALSPRCLILMRKMGMKVNIK